MFEAELKEVLIKLEGLCKMLEDNKYNDETKSGFITIELREYFHNLKIGQLELEAMLDTEIQNWINNIEKTKN